MTSTWLRDHLQERAGSVDPEGYATGQFYVRRDDERYEECRRDFARRRQAGAVADAQSPRR